MRFAALLVLLLACERADHIDRPAPVPEDPPPVVPTPRAAGFLGLRYTKLPGDGVRVMELIPGTPASRAGLAVDDIILRYDDHPLDTVDALVKHVRVSKVGHIAKLLVERDGQRVTLLLPVVERPDDAMARAEPAPQWPP